MGTETNTGDRGGGGGAGLGPGDPPGLVLPARSEELFFSGKREKRSKIVPSRAEVRKFPVKKPENLAKMKIQGQGRAAVILCGLWVKIRLQNF
jgi:hypothetical protein